MGFVVLFAGLHALGLAIDALDPAAAEAFYGLEQSAFLLCVIAWAPLREALIRLCTAYWLCAAAFVVALLIPVLLIYTRADAGGALYPAETRREVLDVAALCFGAAGAGA